MTRQITVRTQTESGRVMLFAAEYLEDRDLWRVRAYAGTRQAQAAQVDCRLTEDALTEIGDMMDAEGALSSF